MAERREQQAWHGSNGRRVMAHTETMTPLGNHAQVRTHPDCFHSSFGALLPCHVHANTAWSVAHVKQQDAAGLTSSLLRPGMQHSPYAHWKPVCYYCVSMAAAVLSWHISIMLCLHDSMDTYQH